MHPDYTQRLAEADLRRFDWTKAQQLRGAALALWMVLTSPRIPYRPVFDGNGMEVVECRSRWRIATLSGCARRLTPRGGARSTRRVSASGRRIVRSRRLRLTVAEAATAFSALSASDRRHRRCSVHSTCMQTSWH